MTVRTTSLASLTLLFMPSMTQATITTPPCVQTLEVAMQRFHHSQVESALHYYKSWLPGYEAADPEVRVHVHAGPVTAQTLEVQVDVEADVKLGYSRSPPVECRSPMPPKVHPLARCAYHAAMVHLSQTGRVACRHAGIWRCAVDRHQLQSTCTQQEALDEPSDKAGEQRSMCSTYAPSWSWGRLEDRRASFHARLASFVADQLSALNKDAACPLAAVQEVGATASDGN